MLPRCLAAAQGIAPVRMRAIASAVVLFAMSLVGLGIGPLLVGALNDAFEPRYGDEAIRVSLLVLGLFNVWGAVHYLQAARWLRAELSGPG